MALSDDAKPADPLLTDVGEEQAKEAHAAWAAEIPSGALLPEKLYTSPMTRAMHTNDITFEGLYAGSRPTVTIVEVRTYLNVPFRRSIEHSPQNCREHYGKHTCDKRQTRTRIHADFPQLIFEEGFAEEDELWTPVRETEAHIDERARKVLDRVFDQDPETCQYPIITYESSVDFCLQSYLSRPMAESSTEYYA